MLFDLQSRGRRNAVKVIYTFLAVLLGGGLVLFGIGTGTGGGGLFDVFKGGSTSSNVQISAAEKRLDKTVQLHPTDAQAWADLARARYQTAGVGNNYDQSQLTFTKSGVAELGRAAQAWQRYLGLNPKQPDAALARLMAQAYSENGLNQPQNAAQALEFVAEQQPIAANFGLLANYAYLAGDMRKGDLAAAKAVQLAPKAQQKLVKQKLAAVRKQALTQQVQKAVQRATTTTPRG